MNRAQGQGGNYAPWNRKIAVPILLRLSCRNLACRRKPDTPAQINGHVVECRMFFEPPPGCCPARRVDTQNQPSNRGSKVERGARNLLQGPGNRYSR